MLLYYIRHGEPVYVPDSLTENGKRQAEALSKRLAQAGLDEIYASSSQRAIATASPTSVRTGIPVKILDWCNENYAFGELATVDQSDGECRWAYQQDKIVRQFVSPEIANSDKLWYEHEWFADKNYGKGIERIARCTYEFMKSLGYEHDGNTNLYKAVNPNRNRIALFAHEGFGMAFLSALLDIPYPMFCTKFGLEHSSMTVISFDGNGSVVPKMLQLSNDSHLYKEGLSTEYNGGIKI